MSKIKEIPEDIKVLNELWKDIVNLVGDNVLTYNPLTDEITILSPIKVDVLNKIMGQVLDWKLCYQINK